MKRKWLRIALLFTLIVLGAGGVLMADACSQVGVSAKGDRLVKIEASPHYEDDQFVNTVPARNPSFFKALWRWIKGAENTKPAEPVPVVKRTKDDFLTPPKSGLRITWLGHSTTLVEIDGRRLLLDPMWSKRSSPYTWVGPKRFFDPPLPLEELPPVDGVLISHDHYDHLDKPTVVKLAATGTTFIVPLGIGADLEYWGIPRDQIVELEWWQTARIGRLIITATPARHFSGRSLVMADKNETLWAGFAIQGPRHRVYYSGDTGMFEEFEEIGEQLGPFDAALMEMGAYNEMWADLHLGPEQAVQAFLQVKGGLLIPVHWGTFDLALHAWTEPAERLLAAAEGRDIPLAIPQPGQSVEPSKPPTLARWWPRLPWQTAEEHPVVSSKPQRRIR